MNKHTTFLKLIHSSLFKEDLKAILDENYYEEKALKSEVSVFLSYLVYSAAN